MSRIRGDLLDRSFDFACKVLDVSPRFPNDPRGWVVAKQFIRSGTSVGSNIREADNALTDAEFAHKCSIARREAAESHYWLQLAIAAQLLPPENAKPLSDEADELARILSTIVLKTQRNTHEQRRKPNE